MALTSQGPRPSGSPNPASYSPLDRQRVAPPLAPSDDYLLETDIELERTPVRLRAARLLQAVLIVVIAALSLAVFWMIALMIGVL